MCGMGDRDPPHPGVSKVLKRFDAHGTGTQRDEDDAAPGVAKAALWENEPVGNEAVDEALVRREEYVGRRAIADLLRQCA